MFLDETQKDSKRSLSIRDKQILYRNAQGRCENPACGKKIDFDEMEVGHKTAWSKGGKTTLKNSVCLCARCNKLQGTDSWATFLKKQNIVDPREKIKKELQLLTIPQLKYLTKKYKITVKGTTVEDFWGSHRKAPTKSQYIKKLLEVVNEKDINSIPKDIAIKSKKPKKKKTDDWWL